MSRPCENLEPYHHRGLETPDRKAFEAHLPTCDSCRAGLESLRAMDDRLSAAISPPRSDASWNELATRIRGRIDATPSARPRRTLLLGGIAAAVALSLGIYFLLKDAPAPTVPSSRPISKAPERAPLPPTISPAPPIPPKLDLELPIEDPPPAPVAPAPAPPVVNVPPPPRAEAPSPVTPVAPAPSRTVVVRARVEKVKGGVFLGTPAKSRIVEGQEVLAGQEIVTEGLASTAVLAQTDASRLEVGPDTRLIYPEAKAGVHLAEGSLTIEAASTEGVCTTPHAEIRFQAARFSLNSGGGSTRLLAHQGSVSFHSVAEGATRQVRAGQLALAPLQAGVDQKRVDEAIRKGIESLKTAESTPWSIGPKDSDDLILLTMIHAGVPESDPKFQQLLKAVLDAPLETTYEVAVQAMALEELHRVKHQGRLGQCAQFLIDNQCKNGQWGYGKPTIAAMEPPVPTTSGGTDVSTKGGVREFDAGGDKKAKPKVTRKIPVRKSREGPAAGDNSNSQYAALGLRACHDAGIVIPKDVLLLAKKWWVESQIADPKAPKNDAVATGRGLALGTPQGWCYRGYHHDLKYCKNPDQAYASMTAGAAGALAIYDTLLGTDWKKDKAVLNGMAWLARNWTWTEVAGTPEIGGGKPRTWLCYHFYAVERLGMLCDAPKIGDFDWYLEGANVLLDAQKPTGAWLMSAENSNKPTWDTCFAILFLKRATRPLDVATEDRQNKRPGQDPK